MPVSALPRRALHVLVLAVLLFASMPATHVFAATSDCPSGLSPLDCAALYGDWTSWVPDDGSSQCGVTSSGGGILPGGASDSALSLNGKQVAIANTIIGIAKTENLGQAGAIVGLMVALDESHLQVYSNSNVPLSLNNPNAQKVGSDHYSLGVFQQQITTNWSTISTDINSQEAVNQLMDPAYNAEAFFGSPKNTHAPSALSKGLQNVTGWQSMDPWVAAQAVQISGDSSGLNYKQFLGDAQKIIAKYYDSAPAVPIPVPFAGAGSGTTGNASDVCAGGVVVAGNIIQTALGLAWPSGGHGKQQSDATKAYQAAMPKAEGGDPGDDSWSDCGIFVATVIRSSGADPNYQKRQTSSQEGYMESHPELYKPLGTITSSAQVKPGDIFVNNGHTFIYVGPQKGGNAVTEGSWGDHVPQLDTPLYFTNFGQPFKAFELIGQGGA